MRGLFASVRESLGVLWRLVRLPAFYLLLALSLAVWALAYQQKAAYTVDVGGPLDWAYVSNFYAPEKAPPIDYRWSKADSAVRFPGIGNEPVLVSLSATGSRPNLPPPLITVTVRGQSYPVQLLPELHTYTFSVPRGDPWDGDITIGIHAQTFNVERTSNSNGRDLGVTVDAVGVSPADYGLRPFVVPPIGTMGGLLLGLVLLAASVAVATRRRVLTLGFVAVLATSATLLILLARTDVGLLAPQLPSLGLWALCLSFAGRAILDWLLVDGTKAARFTISAGVAAFVLAFLLRYGGVTYPQFLTSDLGLNIHIAQAVQHGTLIIYEPLPDGVCTSPPQPNGSCVPYPPALYVVLAPFSLLFGSSDAAIGGVILWLNSWLDAASCLVLAWAGYRLWRGTVGAWAALAYAVSPAPFDLFSAGNHANLFAQELLNIALLGGLVYLNGHSAWSRRASRIVPAVAVCLLLTMLGHYGTMLSTLAIAGVFGAWTVIYTLRGRHPVQAWVALGLVGATLGSSLLLYYCNVLDYIEAHFAHVLQKALHAGGSVDKTQSAGTGGGRFQLGKLGAKVEQLWSAPAIIVAVLGSTRVAPLKPAAGAWLGSWLGVALFFALLDQLLGDAIRWYYLGAAALALLVGRGLALLFERRRGNRYAVLLVYLVLGAMLEHLLSYWVGDLIFTRYHS